MPAGCWGALPSGGAAVAVGGDGTVALVAAPLARCGRADTPIGIVPYGTANVLARTLGISDEAQIIAALGEGEIRRLDAIRTSDPERPNDRTQ